VVSGHRERGLHTRSVGALGSVREKENPRDRQIWKMCTGFKNPLELHRNVEIAIREIPNSSGPSIGGNTWLPDDVSAPRKPKGKNLVVRKSRNSET
jgi:hypothetical protein